MSITDSAIAPALFLIAAFAVLAAFFRKSLIRVIVILVIEVVFLALFPSMLLKFVNLITQIHHALG